MKMLAKKHCASFICFTIIVSVLILQTTSTSFGEQSVFKVALTGKYPPFSTHDETGELVGFDVDVSKEIAKRLQKKLVFVETEWDGILPGLLAGKYDAIIGSMAITEARKQKVNFSKPYYRSGAQLFIHKKFESSINDINDCSNKAVGVVLGETFEHSLRNNYPDIDTRTYKSTVQIFQDVKNQRLVGFVSDKLLGAYQIKESNMPFVPAGDLLYKEEMAIPVAKSDDVLLNRINESLTEMEKDGKLQQLFDKWFGLNVNNVQKGMQFLTITKMLAKGFGITLLVAFFSVTIGFVIAVPWGIILNHSEFYGHWLSRTINDFIRGTPVLIQLFFVYFGLGSLSIGVNLSPLLAAIITMSINASAYMAEVVRSGLMSVDPGQAMTAKALGLSKMQTFFSVIWPQAFRVAIPPLVNSTVALIKDTALISVIAVGEVVREAQSIISVTFNPMKYYLIVASMFFVVTFPLMKFTGRLERKIKEKGYK